MGEGILSGGTASGGGSSSSSGNGLPPTNCRNLDIKRTGTTVRLKWNDPADTVINGLFLCSWQGTKIVRKAGGYPTSPSDGTLIVDNTSRDNYASNDYVDTVSSTEVEYFYRAFPYSVNGVYNNDDRNKFGAIIFGFVIDELDPNPATRVKYIEANEHYKPAKMNFSTGIFDYGDWEDAFIVRNNRPVMLNTNGTIAYELFGNDLSLKTDGDASDVANQSFNGDAMSEIPLCWLKLVTSGTKKYVYFSNKQVDSNYKAYAHINKDGDLLEKIYMPIYKGAIISSKLRSISGVAPGQSTTAAAERAAALAKSEYHQTRDLSEEMLIRLLLVLLGKSTNIQETFGNGHHSGGSQAAHLQTTGANNTKGRFYGDNGNGCVSVFYMQNFYGDRWDRIAGWINDNGTQKIKLTHGTEDGSTTTGYNDTGSGYIPIGLAPSGTTGGYISKTAMNQYGIFPQVANGSSSTYYCDGLWFNNAQVSYALVGGACDSGLTVGAFASHLSSVASVASWDIGASLSCKPAAQAA